MAKISLSNVSLEFPIYDVSARSIKKHFIRAATGSRVLTNANEQVIVKAINKLTLEFNHGDRVGLVGHNGAGKSTLLRLLAGIYEPTHGDINIVGQISTLLDFTQGIEGDLTGYENIYLRGNIMGLSRKQIRSQTDDIAALTGLGDYLAMPTRTYSSGMLIRLAFAISSSIQPEILLVDEVFGAGDAEFITKSREHITKLLNKSSIVIMASHSDAILSDFCNKGLVMENGSVKFIGSMPQALSIYHGIVDGKNQAAPVSATA